MNRWQEDFMRGYSHADFFNKWCVKMHLLLDDVKQCGLYELDNTGHGFIAGNCPEIGEDGLANKFYLYDNNWRFDKNNDFKNGVFESGSHSLYDKLSNFRYKSDLDLSWVVYKIGATPSIQRGYFIVCETPKIYNIALNNIEPLKKLFRAFIRESEYIINLCKDNKVNIASVKPDYFIERDINNYSVKVAQLNELFKSKGMFDEDVWFTDREWECLQLYFQGKSAKETGELLKISRRTVESYFTSIKRKLKVYSKSDILDIII